MRHFILLIFLTLSTLSFAKTKILHIIGGDVGHGTKNGLFYEEICQFQQNQRFYNNDSGYVYILATSWSKIKIHAIDADIIIYSGHGSENSSFSLINKTIRNETFFNELKVKSSVKVLYTGVCTGAGSSATDTGYLEPSLAKRRVLSHAKMWQKLGCNEYYANNRCNKIFEYVLSVVKKEETFKSIIENCYQYDKYIRFHNIEQKIYKTVDSDMIVYLMENNYPSEYRLPNGFESSYVIKIK